MSLIICLSVEQSEEYLSLFHSLQSILLIFIRSSLHCRKVNSQYMYVVSLPITSTWLN